MQILLASKSPRRAELMKLIAPGFTAEAAEIEEIAPKGVSPEMVVLTLAKQKAREVAQKHPAAVVIGADTVVVAGHEIFGKPADPAEAAAMLRMLSGKVHQVYTGVCVLAPTKVDSFFCTTSVEFERMSEDEIQWYVQTGEPMDKAGAYGIQGYAARFIKGIRGDYTNVVGLPVNLVYLSLRDLKALD